MRKTIILGLVLLNFSAVVYSNLPPRAHAAWQQPLKRRWDQLWARKIYETISSLSWYAVRVGLEQKNAMFAGISRSNYRLTFTGIRDDGWMYPFPIALQGERTFLQRNFFDHKAAKFNHNMMNNPTALRMYALYLCREFQQKSPPWIRTVRVDWVYRDFLPREEALKTGSHYSPLMPEKITKTQDIRCPDPTGRVT